MPITNSLPIVNPIVQEVKPVGKSYVAQTPVVAPEVKSPVQLTSARPSGRGGNPQAPTAAGPIINSVPQTVLPSPGPTYSYR